MKTFYFGYYIMRVEVLSKLLLDGFDWHHCGREGWGFALLQLVGVEVQIPYLASVIPQAGRRLLITVNGVGISRSPVSLHWNHQAGRDESLITAPMWPPLTLGRSSLHMPGCWWRFWPSTKPPLTQTQGGGGHLIIARWEWKFRLPWSPLTPWVGTPYSLEMKVATPYLTFSDTSLVLGRRIWSISMTWWE